MDGKSATTYLFGGGATFDGVTLTIPEKLILKFTKEYSDGHLVIFREQLAASASVIDLLQSSSAVAFIGDYYDAQTSKLALSIKSDLEILFDFSIFFAPGELQQVSSFNYIPAMFVLTFSGGSGSSGGFSAQPGTFTLMLGTASKNGLACSIQGGGTPKFAVSILPFP